MRLENKLIDLIKNTAKTETGTDTTAKVLRVEKGIAWVHIDGGAEETPVYETIACSPGDMVNVRISKGTAFLVGNGTAPPTDDTEAIVAKIKAATAQRTADEAKYIANLNVGILEANKLTAQTAIVQDLLTAKKAIVQTATITDLSGATADFNHVLADMLNAGTITADQAVIIRANFTTAIGNSLTVGEVDAKKALFAELNADVVEANVLNSLAAEFDRASVDWLNVKRLDADYANIDGANILEAFIGQVFNKNAMIEDAIVTTLDATGRITAVRINADYINANTLKANRIIFLGTDGLFHQLNESGETSLPDQTDDNSLDGAVITASSITADKLTVTDLSAFGADIAGLKLEDSSIHTYGKDNPYSTVEGWYIGTADGGGGIQDNDGDIILSADGRDFDTRSERYNGFTIGNAEEYMRFSGGVLTIKSNNLENTFVKQGTSGISALSEVLNLISGKLRLIGRSFEEGDANTASGNYSHAEGFETVASGEASHAEGESTEASGDWSHAEGLETEASGNYSHAEGWNTIANGYGAHAEGTGTTADASAHSEGANTRATNAGAHAEGYATLASAPCAHAEGDHTEASGPYSHVGGFNTIAASWYQTVIGKYNEQDANDRYAFIIGGGEPEGRYGNYTAFSQMDWTGVNLKGAKIKIDSAIWPTMGVAGTWIMTSTTGVTKLLYQVARFEEPAGGDWEPPEYRYAPDDCEVHEPLGPEENYDYILIGAQTAYNTEGVVWNPNTDFLVNTINVNHPLYQYLSIAFPLSARKNILAVDWDGNIHIPSTARVIADL